MKINFWVLMLISVLFGACSNFENEQDAIQVNTQKLHFYGIKQTNYPRLKGTAQPSKLWHPEATIKIKFLDGTSTMQDEVKNLAKEWLDYAGIKFNYITDGSKADVRISFGNADRYVSWSYTGTDCKHVTNQNEATMNFAFWNELTAIEKKGDALRTFGQMLGLELEHRHLSLDPLWGSRIQSYWESELGDIPWETLQESVFDPLQAEDVLQTAQYDPSSIMIWPFTLRGLVTYPAGFDVPKEYNTELSATDKEFIEKLYPKKEVEEKAIVVMRGILPVYVYANGQEKEFMLSIQTKNAGDELQIDYGNGMVETLQSRNDKYIYISKALQGDSYEIKIYGDNSTIDRFGCNNNLTSIDVSKNTNLTDLNCSGPISSIDVSKNTKLERLAIGSSKISSIDVSKNINLKEFYCQFNQLTSLDVSKNTNLTNLNCAFNQISSIDISKNINLVDFNCETNYQISSLDVSKNTELRWLNCENNQLTSLDVYENIKLAYLKCRGNRPLKSLILRADHKYVDLSISNPYMVITYK